MASVATVVVMNGLTLATMTGGTPGVRVWRGAKKINISMSATELNAIKDQLATQWASAFRIQASNGTMLLNSAINAVNGILPDGYDLPQVPDLSEASMNLIKAKLLLFIGEVLKEFSTPFPAYLWATATEQNRTLSNDTMSPAGEPCAPTEQILGVNIERSLEVTVEGATTVSPGTVTSSTTRATVSGTAQLKVTLKLTIPILGAFNASWPFGPAPQAVIIAPNGHFEDATGGGTPSSGGGGGGPSTTPPTGPSPAVARNYTVLAGDTLTSIASKFHVSVALLKQLNPGMDPDNIQAGQTISVPGA
jgi:LysM repeat protein